MPTNGSKKKGRPPGSKNLEYVVVRIRPERCNKCRSTEFVPMPGAPATLKPAVGVIDGEPYNKIRRQRSKCVGCGQATTLIKHIFEGNNLPNI
jgi:ribosomal protein S27AE